MVSATGCSTSHMMITGPDGSIREVDKSKPTTCSECGNMHIVQGQNNTIEISLIAVQFERLWAHVRNMDFTV